MATNVSDQNFDEEVLKSSEPVLVDFHAEWCGPCKAMAPALEEVSQEMAGKVKVVKVDVDANPEITTKYQIQAMPIWWRTTSLRKTPTTAPHKATTVHLVVTRNG